MAYISITDLPELQKDKMNGLEYLLVTNSNLESNKLKLETASDFIYDSVSEKIFTEVKDVLDMHESKIKILDEGVEVGLSSKINFIGAEVNSFANNNGTGDYTIDVFIPGTTVSSRFNTKNSTSDNTIQNAQTELRFISRPSFDGAPFVIGDWSPGSIQKCVNDNVIYNFTNHIYVENNSKFRVYIIQKNINLDYLEFLTEDGDYSSTFENITASISNKVKELSHFKCNLSLNFNLKTLLKGRFILKIEYIDESGTYTFIEDDIFYDNNTLESSIETSVSINNKVSKFLSGIHYVGQGSSILTQNTLKNSKQFSFPENIVDFDGSLCGVENKNLLVTDLDFSNLNYDSDISFNTVLAFSNNKCLNNNLILKSRVNDWVKGAYVQTNFSEIIDTNLDNSTRVYEDFTSETFRLKADFTSFNSTEVLGDSDLQVYNSKLVYPQINFSSSNNPDYSTLSGDRSFIRKFWHQGVSHSNGLFTLISNITELDLNTKIKIEISLDEINWFNCGIDYSGGNLINNSGCRINSDVNSLNINNKIEFTLGLNKFTSASNDWGIFVKITYLDSAKDKYIDVLQITNW